MLEINAAFGQEAQNLGLVGRTGENASRRIVFDCEAVLGEFPGAGIVCALRRACDAEACDAEAYAKELTAEGKKRLLTLSAADVAAPGSLMIELRAVEADAIRKSAVYVGRIERGLSGQGDAPGNPVADTINNLEARAKAASAAASAAQAVADDVKAKLEAGEFKGDPGSDAEVTAENIQSALGYAPVTPSALAAKQDALTDADRQSITKTGMTTGPAWTAAQQKAARDRMGIDKAYELIEEIALTERSTVMRTNEPDGTPYKFDKLKYCVIVPASAADAGLYVNAVIYSDTGIYAISYTALSSNVDNVVVGEMKKEGATWECRQPASGRIGPQAMYKTAQEYLSIPNAYGEYIAKFFINVALPTDTKIYIYGVRV